MADTNQLVVDITTALHHRVRLARIAAGRSRAELAEEVGVSKRTYERIETGSRSPRRAELDAIAQATGQDVSFFRASSGNERARTVTRSGRAVKR